MPFIFFARNEPSTASEGTEPWILDGPLGVARLIEELVPGDAGSRASEMFASGRYVYFNAESGSTGIPALRGTDGTVVTALKSGSDFDEFTDLNGRLFFLEGVRPWVSDGTAASTVDLAGGAAFNAVPASSPVNVGGVLFFAGGNPDSGRSLWRSDGTVAGTTEVKSFGSGPGFDDGSLFGLTNVRGTLYFVAESVELWKSDGTSGGTEQVWPGIEGHSPNQLTSVGGTLFFTINDGVHGGELWKSDGTEAGTVLVKDVRPGEAGSSPSRLTELNGTLFFIANDGEHGAELWKSDGTEDGTVLVADIAPGSQPGFLSGGELLAANGLLFLNPGGNLFRSDGTEAGTFRIKDLHPPTFPPTFTADSVEGFELVNGLVYFHANNGSATLADLWRTDGTEAGTVKILTNISQESGIAAIPTAPLFFQGQANGDIMYADMVGGVLQAFRGAVTGLGSASDWRAGGTGEVTLGLGGEEIFIQSQDPGFRSIYMASNDSGALAYSVVSFNVTGAWDLVAAADVSGDGRADPIIRNNATGGIYYGDMAGGAFQGWRVAATGLDGGWTMIGAGDINGDRFADIVVQNSATSQTGYVNMAGGVYSGFGAIAQNVGPDWRAVAVGDLEGDGCADVVFQNSMTTATVYADMRNGGAFDHWGIVARNVETTAWKAESTLDLDNDSEAEVVFRNSDTGAVYFADVNAAGPGTPTWGVVSPTLPADLMLV